MGKDVGEICKLGLMRKVLLVFGIVLMTVSSCDCGCENRMNALHFLFYSMQTTTLPVDLPRTENVKITDETILEIGISPEGKYFTNIDPESFLNFEKLEGLLVKEIENSGIGSVKISGDRSTDYESVLKVIALCKTLELKPILAYQDN